jgi:hypothetical protein
MTAFVETCQIGGPHDGWFSCWIQTTGQSADECRALTEQIMTMIAPGRRRLIRVPLWSDAQTDFATNESVCRGGARFAFRDETGSDEVVADASVAPLRYLPAAEHLP